MKSDAEKRFDKLSAEYRRVFGGNYPLVFTSSMSFEEICDDIEKCVSEGKAKEKPQYIRGCVY